MRFVFDENASPKIAEALRSHGIDAAHVRDIWGAGKTDEELAGLVAPDDIFVSFDTRLLGRHVEARAFARHQCAVLSLRTRLKVREQMGLFLMWATDLLAVFAADMRPCVLNVSKPVVPEKLREIRPPPMAYGGGSAPE